MTMPNLLARLLTRSFPGKSETQFQPLGPDASDPASDAPVGYESRAFKLWIESLAQSGLESPRILDLGKVHAQTLGFFQKLGASFSVMDLDISLKGTAFEMALEAYRDWGPFDGVLAWDLPNYMASDELSVLGTWLEAHTGTPCPLLVCMATRTPYADQPGRYSVVDEATLLVDPGSSEVTRTDRHVPNVLKRAWPSFSPNRSFLLRNGMQEFVLTRSALS
ncbi:MAG: hypothetical protein AAF358_09210 [Pseudomonadota bacterium]